MEMDEIEKMLLTPAFMQRGMSQSEIDALYAIGYHYYRSGAYDKAETVFKGLCLLDSLNESYHMALGATFQALKKWKDAIDQYALVVTVLNLHNVKAAGQAAECFEALGDKVNAAKAREHAKLFAQKEAK